LTGNAKRRISINKSKILIRNSHPLLKPPVTHRYVKSAINRVMLGEKARLEALYINLVDKKRVKQINKKFLKHDYFTDIITFPYEETKSGLSAEIFMCLDVIKENAKIYKVSYHNEFQRVLIHGCLHLAGYGDKSGKEKELIRSKENFYLSE
jgi:probable rRNA maturation factor